MREKRVAERLLEAFKQVNANIATQPPYLRDYPFLEEQNQQRKKSSKK